MDETAKAVKALSESIRLRMIHLLAYAAQAGEQAGAASAPGIPNATDELCVCDMMAVLELPQSTASRHLGYLKNAGWVTDRRSKKWVYYRLAPELAAWRRAMLDALLVAFRESPAAANDAAALGAFLKTKERDCSEAA